MAIHRQFVPAQTRSRRTRAAAIVFVVAVIFLVPPLRRTAFDAAGAIGLGTARVTRSVGGWIGGIGTGLRSKRALVAQNESLRAELGKAAAQLAAREQLLAENAALKEALGRRGEAHFIVASVLRKPPVSAYDTLVIDGGGEAGLAEGQTVYAYGETPIGTIVEVSGNSAVVRLWSAPGEKTAARLSPAGIDIELVGRGGGNFEAIVPQDLAVPESASAVTRELNAKVLARFRKVISDPRDPFQTLLMSAPVNVQMLSFVEVRQ